MTQTASPDANPITIRLTPDELLLIQSLPEAIHDTLKKHKDKITEKPLETYNLSIDDVIQEIDRVRQKFKAGVGNHGEINDIQRNRCY